MLNSQSVGGGDGELSKRYQLLFCSATTKHPLDETDANSTKLEDGSAESERRDWMSGRNIIIRRWWWLRRRRYYRNSYTWSGGGAGDGEGGGGG